MKRLKRSPLRRSFSPNTERANREDGPLSAHPPYPILITTPIGLLLSPDYLEILLKDLSSSIHLLWCRLMDML